jgi:phosphinothricin acetyltransferase
MRMPGSWRHCVPADAPRICEIYNHYVRDTVVTFEEVPVSAQEMSERIAAVTSHLPWLVWERDRSVVGYAYATPWKPRSAYRFSVESTVYLDPGFVGLGVGTALYRALIDGLRERDLHCAIGGIALPNPASIALHEKLGFAKIGQFEQVGFKRGRWIDVGYWELVLRN